MKSFYRHLSTRQLIMAGLVIPLLCTFVIGGLQYLSIRELWKTRELVRNIRNVQVALGTFRYSLSDAESCQFRFLLSGNKANLDWYHEFLNTCNAQFKLLRTLTADNAVQQRSLDQIEILLKIKISSMDSTLALDSSGSHASALQTAGATQNGTIMMPLENLVEKMQAVESQSLEEMQSSYESHFRINSVLAILSMFLCVFFIIAILLLLLRLFRLQSAVTANAVSEMIKYEAGGLTIEQYLERRYEALATHGHAQIEAERLIGLIEKKKLRPVKD